MYPLGEDGNGVSAEPWRCPSCGMTAENCGCALCSQCGAPFGTCDCKPPDGPVKSPRTGGPQQRSRKRERVQKAPADLQELAKLLGRTIQQVRAGQLTHLQGNAVSQLARQLKPLLGTGDVDLEKLTDRQLDKLASKGKR